MMMMMMMQRSIEQNEAAGHLPAMLDQSHVKARRIFSFSPLSSVSCRRIFVEVAGG